MYLIMWCGKCVFNCSSPRRWSFFGASHTSLLSIGSVNSKIFCRKVQPNFHLPHFWHFDIIPAHPHGPTHAYISPPRIAGQIKRLARIVLNRTQVIHMPRNEAQKSTCLHRTIYIGIGTTLAPISVPIPTNSPTSTCSFMLVAK